MTRPLCSNLGAALSAAACAKAALGFSKANVAKPKTAVVDTSSELVSCFSHLDGIAAEVKSCIREAAGLPFEIRTTAPSDLLTTRVRSLSSAFCIVSIRYLTHAFSTKKLGPAGCRSICCGKTSSASTNSHR